MRIPTRTGFLLRRIAPVVVVAVGGECYVCWGGAGVLEDAGDVGVDGGDWVWGVVVFVGG